MTQQEEKNNESLQDIIEETEKLENLSDQKETINSTKELEELKDKLARVQADYQNFKFRSDRDKSDMVFFIKNDIFKKILPRIDDLERMIKNTSETEKAGALYEAILVLEKSLKRDIENMGVIPFISIGEEVDPNKHEVMTQVPSETPGKIIDEFENSYMLGDRVFKFAKVIVGS